MHQKNNKLSLSKEFLSGYFPISGISHRHFCDILHGLFYSTKSYFLVDKPPKLMIESGRDYR